MEGECKMVKDDKKYAEILYKIEKVRKIIKEEKLSGVLLSQQYNICWLTAGANNHVLWDDQNSLIGILITKDKEIVLAENGDYYRIQDEEFFNYPFEYIKIPWYGPGLSVEVKKVVKGKIGVDTSLPGVKDQVNIDGMLSDYRAVLMDSEIERFSVYGKEAAEIITKVAKNTRPGIKESEIAAMLSKEFVENGFNVAVILIGGDNRSLNYRHQVVTDYKIKKHYCFVGVGKKGGFDYPICRAISFGEPPEELKMNNDKIETVYVYLNSLAKIGVNLKEIFNKLPDIYSSVGLDKDEWKNHTQGGTMGYLPRERIICEGVDYVLKENNVIGWNPSLPGVMAEDVYLLKKDGLEYITYDKRWPYQEISINGLTQKRPDILVI